MQTRALLERSNSAETAMEAPRHCSAHLHELADLVHDDDLAAGAHREHAAVTDHDRAVIRHDVADEVHRVALSRAPGRSADELIEGVERGSGGFLGEIGAVFHLGACSATTERDAGFLMRNNFGYTKALAEWALARRAACSMAARLAPGLP